MNKLDSVVLFLAIAALSLSFNAFANPAEGNPDLKLPPIPDELLLLAPPPSDGPVVVFPAFELNDINQIRDTEETVEFTGVLTLVWKDPSLAFRPTAGVNELAYQGNYQFNEIATG